MEDVPRCVVGEPTVLLLSFAMWDESLAVTVAIGLCGPHCTHGNHVMGRSYVSGDLGELLSPG